MIEIQPSAYHRFSLKGVEAITVKNSDSGKFFTVNRPRAFFLRSANVGGITIQGSDPSETVRLPADAGAIVAIHLADRVLVGQGNLFDFLTNSS